MPEKLLEILHPRDSKSELRPHPLFETVPDPITIKNLFYPHCVSGKCFFIWPLTDTVYEVIHFPSLLY